MKRIRTCANTNARNNPEIYLTLLWSPRKVMKFLSPAYTAMSRALWCFPTKVSSVAWPAPTGSDLVLRRTERLTMPAVHCEDACENLKTT